jgi:hypothetical protein
MAFEFDEGELAQPPPRAKQLGGTAEAALYEAVKRCERQRDGVLAVHIHLSRLQSYHRQNHYLRVAHNSFETMVQEFIQRHGGHLYRLRTADLVLIIPGATLSQLAEPVDKLRAMFDGDPAADADADDGDAFASWFDLRFDYDRFLGEVRQLFVAAERLRGIPGAEERLVQGRPPIAPAVLGKLSDILENTDIDGIVRKQLICQVLPEDHATRLAPQALPVLGEVYISVRDLEQAVLPDVDLMADRWLFQYLTRVLDRRVLAFVARAPVLSQPLCLNLNVATLLSDDFHSFDSNLPEGRQRKLIIELQLFDVLADFGAFGFARDWARRRGYRLTLDNVRYDMLVHLDPVTLGFDLIKLTWGTELAALHKRDQLHGLHQSLQRFGAGRLILHRCDKPEAVAAGHALGIALFQGRHIAHMLKR